jgi:hypothetical protein
MIAGAPPEHRCELAGKLPVRLRDPNSAERRDIGAQLSGVQVPAN